MCGIAGIYNYRNAEPVAEGAVLAMLAAVAHRGPDDQGVFLDGSLALGHRRLSILDTSSAGHQPMVSPSGRAVLTYNGEIYNYVELAASLPDATHRLRSRSDTEVILAQYEAMGEKCLQDFIGMFAFALWDMPRQRLLLARDRLGIKPLYWTRTRGGIAFASEIKALLTALDEPRAVNTSAIEPYMRFGYVPGEQTMFQGIYKLLPGHMLVVEKGQLLLRQYWELAFEDEETGDAKSRSMMLRELLADAVRIHLRSDVPLGFFLSGGLDSSAVVALVRHEVPGDLKTFSVAFDMGSAYDERPYARMVSKTFQTEHHEVVLMPDEFQSLIPKFVWQMDEPVTEASAILLYRVAQLAAEHVTVVLSGEGADELFGGYDIYRYMRALEALRSVAGPRSLRGLARLARAMGVPKAEKYLALGALPFEQRYAGVSMYEPRDWDAVYTDDFMDVLTENPLADTLSTYYSRSQGWRPLNRMLYLDTKMWLPDDILVKADKMSMAHSLELRVPFLDHRLVEFAARVPPHEKSSWRASKLILKQAMEGILPRQILRRKKLGFPTPIEFMFQGPLRPYVSDLLSDRQTRQRGYFRQAFTDNLLWQLNQGRNVPHRTLWQLVVLEEWHRVFEL
jgi:asparagine synthase (glutamine-hydrolysing)